MNFMTWTSAELITFFLVLTRTSVILSLVPIYGDKVVPTQLKILFSIALSGILFPLLKDAGVIHVDQIAAQVTSMGKFLMLMMMEILAALVIGFVSQLVFHAIHTAGDFISQMMGLSMASVYDPHMEQQTLVISQILSVLAMLLFLAVEGHYVMLQAVIESFRYIPQGSEMATELLKSQLITTTGNVLWFGIQLAAPMTVCMMLVNIIYGVVAKTLPQLNVLTFSLAAGLLIGTFVLMVSYPSVQSGVVNLFDASFDSLKEVMVVYGRK